MIIAIFVNNNVLSIASFFNNPYPSIITKSLLMSKLFSKKTSIYPEENKFLSYISNASCENIPDGKSKSFNSYDFPTK